MHQKIVTEGIVLGKRAAGEANTLAFLLTEELGLVHAVAISARKEASKLRYGLEPLSLGRYTLVRGKAQWRLTGADRVSRELLAATPAQRKRLGQVSRLLLRLVLGQEPNRELYRTAREGFLTLSRIEANAEAYECVLVLRLLAHLGYLPELPAVDRFVKNDSFTPELAAEAAGSRALLVRLINDSLRATGL